MRITALVLTAVSAVLWGFAGAATWSGFDKRALVIQAVAACAATVLAGVAWMAHAVRDRDKNVLTDAIADFSQRRLTAPTRPEQRLRLVGEVRPR